MSNGNDDNIFAFVKRKILVARTWTPNSTSAVAPSPRHHRTDINLKRNIDWTVGNSSKSNNSQRQQKKSVVDQRTTTQKKAQVSHKTKKERSQKEQITTGWQESIIEKGRLVTDHLNLFNGIEWKKATLTPYTPAQNTEDLLINGKWTFFFLYKK